MNELIERVKCAFNGETFIPAMDFSDAEVIDFEMNEDDNVDNFKF